MVDKIIFTDLDSSLVDRDTYGWGDNDKLISKLIGKNIPVIICTSKTIEEMMDFYNDLKLESPFVVENGGAILFNKKARLNPDISKIEVSDFNDRFFIYKIGEHHQDFVDKFNYILKKLNIKIEYVHKSDDKRILKLTGLSPENLDKFKKRRFDLPFLFIEKDDEKIKELYQKVENEGLRIHKGGKFYHITSDFDKSDPIRILINLYSLNNKLFTIGIGDSLNDFKMLELVDKACLVRKKDLSYEKIIMNRIKNIVKSTEPAPKGWEEVIKKVLKGV